MKKLKYSNPHGIYGKLPNETTETFLGIVETPQESLELRNEYNEVFDSIAFTTKRATKKQVTLAKREAFNKLFAALNY